MSFVHLRHPHCPAVLSAVVPDWNAFGAVITALATVVLALFTYLLWRVNSRLTEIQAESERRNHAIMEYEPWAGPALVEGAEGMVFKVWNNGLKDTEIRDCVLRYEDEQGRQATAPLRFWWHKRDYEGHEYGNDPHMTAAPFHFIGERLSSGQMWQIEAKPESGEGIRTYANPCIVIYPVLGDSIRIPVADLRTLAVASLRAAPI